MSGSMSAHEMLEDLAAHITAKRPHDVIDTVVANGELTLHVSAETIVNFVEFLLNDGVCRFSSLVDITAVDYPGRDKRFDVVYHFLSMYQNHRIRLKAALDQGATMPSITEVHPSAGWFEREVFDLFGIVFTGHPDLRRILTDYGFSGHPLLKDFPTSGYVELRYDEAQKRVVYEPISLVQEYRQFDFMSPWEGANHILPGDEKQETT